MRISKHTLAAFCSISFLMYNCQLLFAQTIIRLDMVVKYPVGPGMTYTKFIDHSAPWSIDVFEADMNNKYFSLETVKSFDKLAAGREKTSDMSKRMDSVSRWSVGAINADFFELKNGLPNNVEVVNSQVLRNERTDWPAFGYNEQKEISFSKPALSGEIILKDTVLRMDGINVTRDTNKLVFYNKYFGNSTLTNDPGFEAIISTASSWIVNDTMLCYIESISQKGYNSIIPEDKMVISASGLEAGYLENHIFQNDLIKILLSINPSVSKLKEMVGGYPMIVEDGVSTSLDPSHSFTFTKHPRTAVGINKDSTKLFFVTVDGRQTSSIGMNLYELADLMLEIGAYQAMNLDGGGSTTMVIRNIVMNSPSDNAGERPVSNLLLAVSNAPLGTLSNIRLSPKFFEIRINEQVQFSAVGMDQFYNPIEIDDEKVIYSISDKEKGEITSAGMFKAGNVSGECEVIAKYGSFSDTAKAIIKIPNE